MATDTPDVRLGSGARERSPASCPSAAGHGLPMAGDYLAEALESFARGLTPPPRGRYTEDRTNGLISWRSLEGSDIRNQGSVRFSDASGDRGTEVRVELQYDAPAGSAGVAVAKLFGEEPGQQIRDDLRRFKQVIETGEVVRSEGSLEGAGQGLFKQRPAQAAEVETRR